MLSASTRQCERSAILSSGRVPFVSQQKLGRFLESHRELAARAPKATQPPLGGVKPRLEGVLNFA